MPLAPGRVAGYCRGGALVALASSAACSLSAGAIATRSPSGNAMSGPTVEASLQLPRGYRSLAGIEWTRTGNATELWRAGLHYGYRAPLAAEENLTWEASARAGYSRGWNGPQTQAGAFAGGKLGVSVRLGRRREPWEGDSLLDTALFLVLDAGGDALAGAGHPVQPEFSARLLLRLHLGSTLFP